MQCDRLGGPVVGHVEPVERGRVDERRQTDGVRRPGVGSGRGGGPQDRAGVGDDDGVVAQQSDPPGAHGEVDGVVERGTERRSEEFEGVTVLRSGGHASSVESFDDVGVVR
ncbi:hypothetical protein O1L60_36725 [Streptomyces diastatochromogenes]|nr:hypothetical protein [Streptomyces diastatochromogenes]